MSKSFLVIIATAVCLFAASDKPENAAYVLGPGDQVSVQVVELPEFGSQPYRVDSDGSVGLPLVGRVRAGGLTMSQFESEVVKALKKQVINPHLVAILTTPRSEPVSVMGAVNNPGTQQVQAGKTLFDALAAAGGLKPDAGGIVTITRRKSEGPLNLPNAAEDPATGRMVATVRVQDVVGLHDPRSNIVVRAHDQIAVPRAQVIYVIGNVKKAGGFTLSEGRTISALEALGLAEGLAANASPKSARILRKTGSDTTGREQIPINLNKVMSGKMKDVDLKADDILFIPDNTLRRMTGRTVETALNTVSGIAIWRGF